ARDHAAIVPAARAVGRTGVAHLARAAADSGAHAGTVEVETAQLETATHVPDAVQHRAMALVGGGVPVLALYVRAQRERDRLALRVAIGPFHRLTRRTLRVLHRAERVVARELPPVAEALVE